MKPANAPKESVAAGREILARQSSLGNSAVRSLPDWIPHVLFLSGLLSLSAHLVLLVVFSFYLGIRYPGAVGFTTEPMREVGIVIKDKGDNPNAVVPGEPREGDATESLMVLQRMKHSHQRTRHPIGHRSKRCFHATNPRPELDLASTCQSEPQ